MCLICISVFYVPGSGTLFAAVLVCVGISTVKGQWLGIGVVDFITRGPKRPWVAHLRKRSKVTVEPFTEDH